MGKQMILKFLLAFRVRAKNVDPDSEECVQVEWHVFLQTDAFHELEHEKSYSESQSITKQDSSFINMLSF